MSYLEFPTYQDWNDHDKDGVRSTRVWRRLLGVEHTVIEWVDWSPMGIVSLVGPSGCWDARGVDPGRGTAGFVGGVVQGLPLPVEIISHCVGVSPVPACVPRLPTANVFGAGGNSLVAPLNAPNAQQCRPREADCGTP